MSDLLDVRCGQRCCIHELRRLVHLWLIRVVAGPHKLLRREYFVAILESGVEIHPARRNHEIRLEVFAGLLQILIPRPVINAVSSERKAFAHMPENELQFGELLENLIPPEAG
jgi:hypothetical protein